MWMNEWNEWIDFLAFLFCYFTLQIWILDILQVHFKKIFIDVWSVWDVVWCVVWKCPSFQIFEDKHSKNNKSILNYLEKEHDHQVCDRGDHS